MRVRCSQCGSINRIPPNSFAEDVTCGHCVRVFKTPEQPTAPGIVLGDFLVLRELHRGPDGDDVLAEQLSLKRPVLLKVLPPDLAANEAYVQVFVKTARKMAGMNHPGLQQCYQLGVENGVYFLAREMAGLNCLRDHLRNGNQLDTRQACRLFAPVASALAYAWLEADVLHGNLKPDYLYYTADGSGKVLDVGFATLDPEDLKRDPAEKAEVRGTPQYVCPELVANGLMDHRGDLYSLGISLFEAVTGRQPFMADDPVAVVTMHLEAPPPSPAQFNPKLSKPFCDLVLRLLAKEPQHRFADGQALAEELLAISAAEGPSRVAAAEPGPGEPTLTQRDLQVLPEAEEELPEEAAADAEAEMGEAEEAPAPAAAPKVKLAGPRLGTGAGRPVFRKAPPKKLLRPKRPDERQPPAGA